MLNQVSLVLLLLLVACASGQNKWDTKPLLVIKKELPLSFSNSQCVGIPEDSRIELGPASPFMHDNKIYFVDQYNDRIAVYDLKSEKLMFSDPLTPDVPFDLLDLIVANQNIYVSTKSKCLVRLNMKLDSAKNFPLEKKGRKYINGLKGNKLIISDDALRKLLIFNTKSNREEEYETNKDSLRIMLHSLSFSNGQYFEFNETRNNILLQDTTLIFDNPIQDVTEKHYECKYVFISKANLIFLSLTEKRESLIFYVYKR